MEIKEIAKKIDNIGGKLYLVGGAVRDKLLNRDIYDEDYCVVGVTNKQFEKIFPEAKFQGQFFSVYSLYEKEFALARKETKKGKGHKEFEIQTNENITIEEDLKRRDITINSIAEEVLTGKIIDPFNGIEDLKNGIIKTTSEAFIEDPLRVYRVARFAAMLNFKVDDNTIKMMSKLKNELYSLSSERVFSEFRKALQTNKPSIFFDLLNKAKVLDIHFKEIYDLIGSIQPKKYHPEGDSYVHTMIVVDKSTELTDDVKVRFSCLVHDLGKGVTPKKMQPHHYGHDINGVKLVENLCKRLKMPNLWMKCGKIAAEEHMRAGIFNKMTINKQVDLITKVDKSLLGLNGMKIVVMCDKYRNGKFPNDIIFDVLGKKCINEINGKYIIDKYNIKEEKEIGELIRKERIKWIKNNKENILKNVVN